MKAFGKGPARDRAPYPGVRDPGEPDSMRTLFFIRVRVRRLCWWVDGKTEAMMLPL